MIIATSDVSPVQRRHLEALAALADDAQNAQALMESPAWAWFEQKVSAHIAQLERQVFNGVAQLSERQYDAYIGNRNGLVKALKFVTDAQRVYDQKRVKREPDND